MKRSLARVQENFVSAAKTYQEIFKNLKKTVAHNLAEKNLSQTRMHNSGGALRLGHFSGWMGPFDARSRWASFVPRLSRQWRAE